MHLFQAADRDQSRLLVWPYAVRDPPFSGEVFAGRRPEKWPRWEKLKDEYGSNCPRTPFDRQSVPGTPPESGGRHDQPAQLGFGNFGVLSIFFSDQIFSELELIIDKSLILRIGRRPKWTGFPHLSQYRPKFTYIFLSV
jgi:hypothetical protein